MQPETKKTVKNIVVRVTVAFLIIIAALTYFSSTIDNILLPHVTVTYGGEGKLSYHLDAESVFEYPKSREYTAAVSIPVGEVFIKDGDTVKKGDRLIKYDESEFVKMRDSLYLDVLRLENQLDGLYTSYNNAEDDAAAQSALGSISETEIELNMARISYDDFLACFDDSGCLTAQSDMKITAVRAKAGSDVPAGEALFEYAPVSSNLCFRFSCDKTLDTFVRIGSLVNISVPVENSEGEFRRRSGNATVVEKKETEDGFDCVAQLNEMELADGEKTPSYGDDVIISTDFESQPYKHIVMKSAIQDSGYVYIVTKDADEKRYVSMITVTVIDESDFYAAVEMSADSVPIVLTASKEISDGQRVIVDG